MFDIDSISLDLHRLRQHLRESGRDTALTIEAAQAEADRNGAMLAERLDRIALAEADELDRHADRMADIRAERDQVVREHQTAAADLSARIRTVTAGFVSQTRAQRPVLAAE
ncbi:hypothetical protein BH10PSE7_BH10PSE7_15100 [soil metagenome]